MFLDVEIKLKKRNKILFSRDSQCLQELIKLIHLQNHRTLVMWALDCAKLPLEQFETKYPDERRPRTCLDLCEAWARGKIKMPTAKQAILDSHAVAKKIDDSEYGALCHAIGQAGATVHVETHALGLPIYELTAIVLKYGKECFPKPVSEKINYYYHRLQYWQENTDKLGLDWADFLLDNTRSNMTMLNLDTLRIIHIDTFQSFEEDKLEGFLERLKGVDSLEYIHGIKEQPWRQRVVRYYDSDIHIIEQVESMESVARRFLNTGLTF